MPLIPDLSSLTSIGSFGGLPSFGGSGFSSDLDQAAPSVSIGPITLVGFEIPDSISFGTEQRTIVHSFVGKNRREVQIIGAQPRTIEWTGTFWTKSAEARAHFFEGVSIIGKPLAFSWSAWQYTVVVSRFYYEVRSLLEIPYQITLEVIQNTKEPDDTTEESLDAIPDGVAVQLSGLGGFANSLQSFIGTVRNVENFVVSKINTVTGLVGQLQSSVGSVVNTLYVQPFTIINSLKNQATQLSSYAGETAALFSVPTPAFGISVGVSAAKDVAFGADPMTDLLRVQASAAALAALLSRLTQPPFVANVPVVKDNIFRMASKYYNGNLDAWSQIADANNLKSSNIVGAQTIKLPTVNGIVPSQGDSKQGTLYESTIYPVPKGER